MITNNYTSDERLQIANTIWQRLGSQRFSVMTGCRILFYGERDGNVYLMMSVGKNSQDISLFEVAYDGGKDLYDVRFLRKSFNAVSVIANFSEVYSDKLMTLFEQYTGLTTTLPFRNAS